jgi:aspartate beta-hydroxylase
VSTGERTADTLRARAGNDGAVDWWALAREAVGQGDSARAEQCCRRLLESEPMHVGALQLAAAGHFARGEVVQAISMLQLARQAQPDDPVTLHQLGTVQSAAGDWAGAVDSLARCVTLAPQAFVARLRLGIARERLGDDRGALATYVAAVNAARAGGQWVDDATTPSALRTAVLHAIGCIGHGRRRMFDAVLQPLRQRFGASAMTRVEACLAIYLGERPFEPDDPRQRSTFLHFPGLPARPYYPRERFPWQDALEARVAAIRDELRAVLAQPRGLEPFLRTDSAQATAGLLRSSTTDPAAWDAYFFHRHGVRHDAHATACPRTAALLDALPLARVRNHSPETLYSVLRPGSHILPHRGVTNTRLVTHLPLIVPADCALRVGGEVHAWQEGRCVTFDDTFEHEAWNRSGDTRVVLILDSWNPDLDEAERVAVADLVGAIGDFNRECQLSPDAG